MPWLESDEFLRNKKGQCAFCGADLESAGRHEVPMDGDSTLSVVACSACVARIDKRRPYLWGAALVTTIVALLVMVFRR